MMTERAVFNIAHNFVGEKYCLFLMIVFFFVRIVMRTNENQ